MEFFGSSNCNPEHNEVEIRVILQTRGIRWENQTNQYPRF